MPKFSINQEVWAMIDNAPKRMFIAAIHILPFIRSDNGEVVLTTIVTYDLNIERLHANAFGVDSPSHPSFDECDLFLSAEGLRGAVMNSFAEAVEEAALNDQRRAEASRRA